jgi:hypothetical protein
MHMHVVHLNIKAQGITVVTVIMAHNKPCLLHGKQSAKGYNMSPNFSFIDLSSQTRGSQAPQNVKKVGLKVR